MVDWKDLVSRVTFRSPIQGELVVRPCLDLDMPRLEFILHTTCAITGIKNRVITSRVLPLTVPNERCAVDFLRAIVLMAMEHEIDECMMLDGKYVRDPHPPQKLDIIK